ncbi:MAG: PLP-dependent transferase [Clostridia bacterium]|nr:PLP-dependent transferase [Clostridia bacterium]MBQ5808566.1 PLP-dependent transferase [Clostridia bacterium]
MKTPICDFVRGYAQKNGARLHMPGHKGKSFLGCESLDITEINGADSLYEADGIISESEANASSLFGCKTLYSTEGSSQCIRAMLHLITLYASEKGEKTRILAVRNVHKTFLYAAALLDFEIEWLSAEGDLLSSSVTAEDVEAALKNASNMPHALYITSPDYLGQVADVAAIAEVCRRYGVLLCVDNAHGAYLRFLPVSEHPIDLGAHICCDSAHKTLPVLTGGAYLHIADDAPAFFAERARDSLALFGSTSPSYLIMQSLDAANKYIADGYSDVLGEYCLSVMEVKDKLRIHGYLLYGNEPLKITLRTKAYGYLGTELADILRKNGIECEFADPDYLVFMLTPEIKREELTRLCDLLCTIPAKTPIFEKSPRITCGEKIMSVRNALFSAAETVDAKNAVGRVLSAPSVSCPPAVPIAVCGEMLDENAVKCFEYYGIEKISVVK